MKSGEVRSARPAIRSTREEAGVSRRSAASASRCAWSAARAPKTAAAPNESRQRKRAKRFARRCRRQGAAREPHGASKRAFSDASPDAAPPGAQPLSRARAPGKTVSDLFCFMNACALQRKPKARPQPLNLLLQSIAPAARAKSTKKTLKIANFHQSITISERFPHIFLFLQPNSGARA